jgi:hypothetical protein
MPNFDRSRRVWHGHIAAWGGGSPNNGNIVRGGVARKATMAISEYKPSERGLYVDGIVRIVISAFAENLVDAQVVPDPNLDVVEFKGKRYKITMKPQNPQPDGTWIAFDCPCLFVEDI